MATPSNATLLAQALQRDVHELDLAKPFVASGGDSLAAASFIALCRKQGRKVEFSDILRAASLSELLDRIVETRPKQDSNGTTVGSPVGNSAAPTITYTTTTTTTTTNGETRTISNVDGALADRVQQLFRRPLDAVEDISPCSPLQETFLIGQRLNPATYQCRIALKFSSRTPGVPCSLERMKSAWNQIVRRHPILRTTFIESDSRTGRFDQVIWKNIMPQMSYSSELNDISLSAPASLFAEDQPPHHLTLAQESPSELFIRLDCFHALVDGPSLEIAVRDLCAAYQDELASGHALAYHDFARHLAEEATQHGGEKYWSDYLTDIQGSYLPAKIDQKGYADPKKLLRRVEFSADALEDLCSRHRVTPANVCQLAWGMVLRSYTHSDAIAFSHVTSSRPPELEGIEDAIGLFINTLPCRVRLDPDTPLNEVLYSLRDDFASSLPFQGALLSRQSGNKDPIKMDWGNTIMSFHRPLAAKDSTKAGLAVNIIGRQTLTHHDVSLNIDSGRDAMMLTMEFWNSKVDEWIAERALTLFEEALHFVLRHTGKTANDFPSLTAPDRDILRQLPYQGQEKVRRCIHEMVMEMVGSQPNATAVEAWDGCLSYAQLAELSGKLARHLISLGVGPEVMVGLCMEKSSWAAVCMFAILLAGGAAVPLGVQHPRARVHDILRDTRASVLLADAAHAERLHGTVSSVLTIDQDFMDGLPNVKPHEGAIQSTAVNSENAAWVIFTSGSTGVPKGIILPHVALCTSIKAHGTAFGFGPHVRTLQFANHTFDATIQDIFTTLCFGGCICIPSEDDRMSRLEAYIQESRSSLALLTSTVAGMLNPANIPSMKTLILAGEGVQPAVVASWLSAGHTKLLNSYGPSECSINSSCSKPIARREDAPIIGWPLAGYFWICHPEDYNRLAAPGAPGELLLEGPLLARGYLGDEEKTAKAFVRDPGFLKDLGLPANTGRRMYRTGDIVRQNSDGSVTSLGRRDTQIKIRGQRVESAEVESQMTRLLEGVRLVAIDLVRPQTGTDVREPMLVAGIEMSPNSPYYSQDTDIRAITPPVDLQKNLRDLETRLLDILPPYMVPRVMITFTRLPMNASGKLDRRALHSVLEQSVSEHLARLVTNGEEAAVEWDTETEQTLAAAWATALRVNEASIHSQDHFFRLGGDSVSAMKVSAVARSAGLVISVADIIRQPRIRDLARLIDQAKVDTVVEDKVKDEDTVEDASPFQLCPDAGEDGTPQRGEFTAKIAQLCEVEADDIEDVYPSTPLQEGLMATTAHRPHAYVHQQLFVLQEDVSEKRLRRACKMMVALFPILRTRIVLAESLSTLSPATARQVVLRSNLPASWDVHQGSPTDYCALDLDNHMTYGRSLCRFAMVHEDAGDSRRRTLVWTMHHSVYDEWALQKMFQALDRLMQNEMVEPPTPALEFFRYVHEQDAEASRAFWANQLEDGQFTRFPPTTSQTQIVTPTERLAREVKISAGTSSVTTPTILCATWALLVALHTGGSESTTNVVLSGRNIALPGMHDIVAPTVCTVPVRILMSNEEQVTEWLEGVQRQLADIVPFQHFGLQNIRRAVPGLSSDFDPGHLFIVQEAANSSEEEAAITSLGLQKLAMKNGDVGSNYALNIQCTMNTGDLSVEVGAAFDSDVISQTQVGLLLQQFEQIFTALSTSSRQSSQTSLLRDLDILSADDARKILDWNTTVPSPIHGCIHHPIEQMAMNQPAAPAVHSWDGDLTYQELHECSSHWADYLIDQFGTRKRIGICMDKSKWAVVAMLAVIYSGNVVVPLGTQYPVSRIEGIVKDSGSAVVLVDQTQRQRLDQQISAPAMMLNKSQPESFSHESTSPYKPAAMIRPEDIAWIIYTSGSTGIPKGVMLQHSALHTSIQRHGPLFGFSPATRALQFAAHTFDLSIQEMITTLQFGGCVCVPDENSRVNNLTKIIQDLRANFLVLTPTVAGHLNPKDLPMVETVILAGEAINPHLVSKWFSQARVFNAYGPAEASIYASCSRPINSVTDCNNIGWPVSSCFWVVDPQNRDRLQPLGSPGELLIEGPVLASGYLNDARQTQDRFIQDPSFLKRLGLPRGRRLYCTGDLVRQHQDGSCTFLGRYSDTQVKINGQRAEMGDIEVNISRLEKVQEAMVIQVTKGPLKGRLAAGVVLNDQGQNTQFTTIDLSEEPNPTNIRLPSIDHPTFAGLRRQLSEKVMQYMIPNTWFPMRSLPTNASGKIDRLQFRRWVESLPSEVLTSKKADESEEAPSTAIERKLRGIWAQALNLPAETIGFTNSFMSLGGDSISAMHVVSLCRSAGLTVSVRDILSSQAISELKLHVRSAQESDTQELKHVPTDAFDLSPIQKFYAAHIASDGLNTSENYRYNQTVRLWVRQPIQALYLDRALQVLIAKHVMLRARFEIDETGWKQRIVKDVFGSYKLRTSTADRSHYVNGLVESLEGSLNLTKGPLFAADLICTEGDGRQLLVMTAHHLVIDIVSWRIIVRDLEELLKDQALSVPESPVSFAAWSKRQAINVRANLDSWSPKPSPGATVLQDWDYWGLERSKCTTKNTSQASTQISEQTTSRLLGSTKSIQSEPLDVLIASLLTSFSRSFQNRDLPIVHVERHGRESWEDVDTTDLSETVGWFTSITPVQISSEASAQGPVAMLGRVKDIRRKSNKAGLLQFAAEATDSIDHMGSDWSTYSAMEVLLNYHGLFQQADRSDALFTIDQSVSENTSSIGGEVKLMAALGIEISVIKKKLQLDVRFSSDNKHAETIRNWVQQWATTIEKLVIEIDGRDFPLTSLTRRDEQALAQNLLGDKVDLAEVEDVLPCSPIQQGILLSQIRSPSSYLIKQMSHIRPSPGHTISVGRLKSAWSQVVQRHSIMRTVFIESLPDTDGFVQIVLKFPQTSVELLRTHSGETAEDCAARLEPLQYQSGRLQHRFTIIEMPDGNYHGYFEFSHMLVDATSTELLIQDLLRIYEKGSNPTDDNRQDRGSAYSSYVSYLLNQSTQDDDLKYWKGLLTHFEPTIFPALDVIVSPSAPDAGPRTASLKFQLQEEDLASLKRVCLQQEVTLATAFQLAWAIVIGKYTSKSDVCFGYLTSGRDAKLAGAHELVGPMMNMTVCALKIDPSLSVDGALQEAQHAFLAGFEHQRASLADIQHAIHLSEGRLFNTTMSYKHKPSLGEGSNSIFFEGEGVTNPTDYDLDLNISAGRDLTVTMQYALNRFSHSSASRLLNHFIHVVTSLTAHQKLQIADLPLVSSRDSAQLQTWNTPPDRVSAYARSLLLHQLVEQQVSARRDAPAVCAWDGEFTYGALDAAARTLAYHLATHHDVGPEVCVGFVMDKSRWATVAMLAILLAGGVVVPLGVQNPIARIEGILADTKCRVILADKVQSERLGNLPQRILVVSQELINGTSTPLNLPEVQPDNAAWVQFTSGSTGTPKGAVLTHRALSTTILAQGEEVGLNYQTRRLQFAAYTFDVAIGDTFATLAHGGCICVPTEEDRLNMDRLAGLMRTMRVNFANLTPTVANLLHPEDVPDLNRLIIGGEKVPSAVVETWLDHASIFTGYGPSECAIVSFHSRALIDPKQSCLIGYPLANRYWIVRPDNYHELCPIGAPGELLLDGPTLGRGYLNDPDKTSAAFVEDARFLSKLGLPPRRMYRSGDIVQQLGDGSVKIIGRRDAQVKIHGQRVELGEIEHHLAGVSGVRTAVVVCIPDDRLVCGICFDGVGEARPHSSRVAELDEAELQMASLHVSNARSSLSQSVPQYMVPSLWIPLAAIPLNAAGKISRLEFARWVRGLSADALANLSGSASMEDSSLDENDELPASSSERQLREVFAQVLHLPVRRISYDASFLALGGDSISAMHAVSICRSRGLTVSVRHVLQSRGISELASHISVSQGLHFPELVDTPFALSPIQTMYVRNTASNGIASRDEHRFNHIVCLRVRESVPVRKLARALEALVTKHEMLRARFRQDDDLQWSQRVEPNVIDSYSLRTHVVSDRAELSKIADSSQALIDLERGPVFTVELIDMSQENTQFICMTAHHLVVDLVSWRIIARDLEELLTKSTLMNSRALSFQAWNHLLTKHLTEVVSPPNKTGILPFRLPPTNWTYWGLEPEKYTFAQMTTASVQSTPETTSTLFGHASTNIRVSVTDILLAALYHSFSAIFCERTLPVIFVEGHGREPWTDDIDLSNTVGWFTTMTPVHCSAPDVEDVVLLPRKLKELRAQIPENGLSHFASQGLGERGTTDASQQMEIVLNYHGIVQQQKIQDSLFQLEQLDTLSPVGNATKRQAAFAVEVSVVDGALRTEFNFSRASHHQDKINKWVAQFPSTLKDLVNALARHTSSIPTPDDFPLATLTQDDLQEIQSNFLSASGSLTLADVEDIMPCSPIQEGILLSQMKSPATYQNHQGCRFTPKDVNQPVDVGRIITAWRQVVSQNSILRTVFCDSLPDQDKVHQIILRNPGVDIKLLSPNSETTPLLVPLEGHGTTQLPHRLTLMQSGSAVLAHFQMNHAIVDGSSVQLILDQLLNAYDNVTGAEPGTDYGIYIAYLQRKQASDDLSYWTDLLANVEPCHLNTTDESALSITDDKKGPEVAVVQSTIDLANLAAFCRRNRVTVANLLQLAWALVLSSRTGRDQILYAYLVNGRDVPIAGVGNMIGPMINVMASRINLNRNSSVAETVRQIQDSFLQGFEHQRASLAEIQHALQLGDQKLFNTAFTYRHKTSVEQKRSIRVEGTESSDPTEFDLCLRAGVGPADLDIELQYKSSSCIESTARRLHEHFLDIVQLLAQSESVRIEDLSLLPVADAQLIRSWTTSRSDSGGVDACLHELVKRSVKTHPTRPAINSWDGNMTYSDMNDAAQRLALHLLTLGVGPEVKVGICMDKSRWMVVTKLSILYAGGTIVPLGVQNPQTRITHLLEQTQPLVVLVDHHHARRLQLKTVANVLTVDEGFVKNLPSPEGSGVCPSVTPSNAAWIIFTSGSTGTPKGVVLEHVTLSTSVDALVRTFDFGPDMRSLQFSASTFDVSIHDTFTPLVCGGCVCVPSEEERMSNLVEATARLGANVAMITSTVAQMFRPEEVPEMNKLLLLGEPIKPAVISTWAEHAVIGNCYGPAECSICTIRSPLTNVEQTSEIGSKFSGNVWVTDPENYQQLVPLGTPGELLVEGPLVARQYFKDATKTSMSFINDPAFLTRLGTEPDRRMYRTGDIVTQRRDGSLVLHGRRDGQIKVRGQRVETGEVETWISRALTGVRNAAVLLVQETTLVAAVEFDPLSSPSPNSNDGDANALPTSAELAETFRQTRSTLTKTLPAYMVPSIIVHFNRLPMNASGKTDRTVLHEKLKVVLEERTHGDLSRAAHKQRPRDAVESMIQELWASVLKLPAPSIGTEDHFFELGGDSLLAMKMAAAARKAHQTTITVTDIFANPRLADLAGVIRAKAIAKAPAVNGNDTVRPFALSKSFATSASLADLAMRCGIEFDEIEDVYPCTPLQEGLMAITAQQPGAYTMQQVFKLPAALTPARLKLAVETLHDRLPILRTRIVPSGMSTALQVVTRASPLWYTTSDLSKYLKNDRINSVTYGSPLCRFAIVNGDHFVWTMHHSIFDGWSNIKMSELLTSMLNEGNITSHSGQGNPSRFVAYLQQTDEAACKDFWTKQMDGSDITKFPALPRAGYQPQQTECETRHVDLGKQAGSVTVATVLRASWALLLAAHLGTDEATSMLVLSGRNAPVPDIHDIMIPTVTSVPVRVRIDRSRTVREYLTAVHDQATAMQPFEHTGLQNIRRLADLGPEFDPGHILTIGLHMSSTNSSPKPVEITLEAVKTPRNASQGYPLNVSCLINPEDGSVDISANFDPAVLSPARTRRMMMQFEQITRQLSTCNNTTTTSMLVRDVNITSKEDIATLRAQRGFNADVPLAPICLHDLVTTSATATPQALAVAAWDGEFTYKQLEAAADCVTQHLLSLGIMPETPVGLCINKSKWAVAAMIGTLRAGGIVVPLGVQNPAPRIQEYLRDCGAQIVLADDEQADRLGRMGFSVKIERIRDAASSSPRIARQPPKVNPARPAWIIYTSGSTGKPKGVVLDHAPLSTTMLAHGAEVGLGPHTRRFQFAAYTFDVSILDVFATLAHGGCICVPSEEERMDRLTETMHAMQANFAHLTSTVARLVRPLEVPLLRSLIMGGEAVSGAVVAAWLAQGKTVRTAWGASELSVTVFHSKPVTSPEQARCIGRPIVNAYWIVDPANFNRLCPVGAPGEMLIEGPTLGRGYLNDAEKTAAAFVVDPGFVQDLDPSSSPGRRMYRTGDIVRQNEDGTVIFVGRRDQQVKIRGQRVEIGEIESWVPRLLPGARSAAADVLPTSQALSEATLVVAIEMGEHDVDDQGKMHLQPTPQLREAMRTLRTALHDVLPPYMVPRLYLPMTRLPQSASGKLERRQLRQLLSSLTTEELQWQSRGELGDKSEQLNEEEETLCQLWADVLGMSSGEIGRLDNIFYLGGDSISAMRLVGHATSKGLTLSVADIFGQPTLAGMARVMTKSGSKVKTDNYRPMSMINAEQTDRILTQVDGYSKDQILDIFPATDTQTSIIAGNLAEARLELHYFTFETSSAVDVSRLRAVCMLFANEFELARSTFVFDEETLYQIILRSYDLEVPIYNTATSLDLFTRQLVAEEMRRPPKLGRPLFDVAIVTSSNPSAPQHRLIFRISHAVYDGPTLANIWKLLRVVAAGEPIPTAPSFAHFVASRAVAATKPSTAAFWRDYLHGAQMPQVGVRAPHDCRLPAAIATLDTTKISIPSRLPHGTTPANLVKAAWGLALSQVLGQDDIVFADAVSSRPSLPDPLPATLLGCCLSQLPLRITHPSPDGPTWHVPDLLTHVRTQHLQVLAHDSLGWSEIVRDCTSWPRSTAATTCFNFIPAATAPPASTSVTPPSGRDQTTQPPLSLLGADFHPVPLKDTTTHLFDLSLICRAEKNAAAAAGNPEADDSSLLNLTLHFTPAYVPAARAHALQEATVAAVMFMLQRPEGTLAEVRAAMAAATRTVTPTRGKLTGAGGGGVISDIVIGCEISKTDKARVHAAWEKIVGSEVQFAQDAGDLLVNAARTAEGLRKEGAAVSVEGVLRAIL